MIPLENYVEIMERYREKHKAQYRSFAYIARFLAMHCQMFEYEWDLDRDWFERYLTVTGSVLGGQIKGKPACAPAASRVGDLDIYGDGTDGIAPTAGGKGVIRGKLDGKTVICYNNSLRCPDLDLLHTAETLAEIDTSLTAVIQWTRIAPFLVTRDSVTEKSLTEKIKQIRQGNPAVIVDEGTAEALLRPGTSDLYKIDITEPERVTNAQYLSELHDLVLRRYYTLYGIDTAKTSKHAQVTIDEATGMESLSWIMPLDMLRQREDFCRRYNEAFGTSWSVRFGEPWRTLYKQFERGDEMYDRGADPDGLDLGNTEQESGDPES